MGQPSTGRAGIGVLLQVSDGASPPVWATIGNVLNVSAGGVTINMIGSTHLDSPDFYAESTPGLKTSSPWTGQVQFDPDDPTLDSSTGLKKFAEDRSLETFRLNFTQLGLTFGLEVDAYVSGLENIEVSPEALMSQSFTLTPKGAVREVTISLTPTP
jgi:hypothetical protein